MGAFFVCNYFNKYVIVTLCIILKNIILAKYISMANLCYEHTLKWKNLLQQL